MGEVEDCNRPRGLLTTRCPGMDIKGDDINKLVCSGFTNESALAGASRDELLEALPGRLGVVVQLVKVFGEPQRPAAEGEPSSKKRERPPAEQTAILREDYMWDLLSPPRELPITVAELQEFLSRKSRPLPVMEFATLLSVNDMDLVKVYSPEETAVAILVESALRYPRRRPNNEADSSHILCMLTGDFLESLNLLAPTLLRLRSLQSTMDSSRNPSCAPSSSLAPLMRPNFALYLRNALILRWENKIDPAGFATAKEENIKKLKVWSPVYYSELPYVIGGCCGGRNFQWLKLSPKGEQIVAEPISKMYDLWEPGSVAKLLHSVVQMHRLLQRLQERVIVPCPIQLYEEIEGCNGTILFGPEHVLKTLVSFRHDERVEFLRTLYRSIIGSKYLIQLQGEILQQKNSTKLTLYPVGDPNSQPKNLKELQNAMHDMLHGLAELHKAGYTHMDLRWENCIRELVQGEMKWIIIDLEFAGRDGEIWEWEALVTWDSRTLESNKKYTKGSDMYQFGKLIVSWLHASLCSVCNKGKHKKSLCSTCNEGKHMKALGKKMMKERGEAAKMLGDMCPKGCARCKLFDTK